MKTLRPKWILTAMLALAAVAGLVRVLAQARRDPPDQDDQEQAGNVSAPSRVIQRNGGTLIRLTPAEQARAGIETAELHAARARQEIDAPGLALDAGSLVNLAAGYAADQARLRTAENNLRVSQAEYERLKALYANHENVSAKVLQAGEGAFRNDQLATAAARRDLALQLAAVSQSWGNGAAGWFRRDSDRLARVLSRQDSLVQVTLASDGPQLAPKEIWLDLPNRRRLRASLVSSFPRVDPRVQGMTFLYVAPTEDAIEPGLNLMARIPAGPMAAGVLVPLSAVVWLNGEPWVYVNSGANEFTRRAVAANFRLAAGLFVPKGLAPGERVVTEGAQMLLSEEFSSPSGAGEEGDAD